MADPGLSPAALLLPSLGIRYVSGFFTLHQRTVWVRRSASPGEQHAPGRPPEELAKKVPRRNVGNGGRHREKVATGLEGQGFEEDRLCSASPRRGPSLLQTQRRRLVGQLPSAGASRRKPTGVGAPNPRANGNCPAQDRGCDQGSRSTGWSPAVSTAALSSRRPPALSTRGGQREGPSTAHSREISSASPMLSTQGPEHRRSLERGQAENEVTKDRQGPETGSGRNRGHRPPTSSRGLHTSQFVSNSPQHPLLHLALTTRSQEKLPSEGSMSHGQAVSESGQGLRTLDPQPTVPPPRPPAP